MACTLIAIVVNANGPATTKPHAAAGRDNNAYSQARSGIQILRRPDQPFIERRNGQQLINFDLLIKNGGSKTYNLVCIKVQVFDKGAHLELERELNEGGRFLPSCFVRTTRKNPAAAQVLALHIAGRFSICRIHDSFM